MLLKVLNPGRLIALGFAGVIIVGATVLMLPISINDGVDVSLTDAFFTSTSAVCVTGLIAVDTADTFNVFGRSVVALLIQIGGLGVTSVGAFFIILAGKRVGLKQRVVIKEGLNFSSLKGIVRLVKAVLLMTLIFESLGAILSFLVFRQDYPLADAIGISVFHSIAAFNNSGFDILGGLRNLIPYQDNVLLNLVTCGLIIFGGLGFFVIREIIFTRSFKKFSLHTKIVLSMTVLLLGIGTVLLKYTEDITWLGAFFNSTSARTAGFSTYPLSGFSDAGLFVLIVLMFIGASPGSTGGGIKTSTFFVMAKYVYSVCRNKHCTAFKRKIPSDIVYRAFCILLLALLVVLTNTFLLCVLEPQNSFIANFFEVTSAFGTVGLSTGITPDLSDGSKWILIFTMFIGRLGPLTVATLWCKNRLPGVVYSEETVTIG